MVPYDLYLRREKTFTTIEQTKISAFKNTWCDASHD